MERGIPIHSVTAREDGTVLVHATEGKWLLYRLVDGEIEILDWGIHSHSIPAVTDIGYRRVLLSFASKKSVVRFTDHAVSLKPG